MHFICKLSRSTKDHMLYILQCIINSDGWHGKAFWCLQTFRIGLKIRANWISACTSQVLQYTVNDSVNLYLDAQNYNYLHKLDCYKTSSKVSVYSHNIAYHCVTVKLFICKGCYGIILPFSWVNSQECVHKRYWQVMNRYGC